MEVDKFGRKVVHGEVQHLLNTPMVPSLQFSPPTIIYECYKSLPYNSPYLLIVTVVEKYILQISSLCSYSPSFSDFLCPQVTCLV
jgi:hypothetical protein